ncbi:hypothetical protein DKX38_026316 [Salix brachista]|uniref:DUF4283 domain-containing protein n=1 Tax=Salix brachista TaxID=2182728 RepID=A0A5N5K408_9ROSI|nr:hypothetical protein DKX38_026316 [Salix brachista]
MTTASGFMIFRFQREEQMQEILERGPWLFGGKAIILQPWHPLFVFDKNRISKLPVWIRLHGLPFSLWSREGLSLVSSMVGHPLSCDEATFNCTRLDFARVCVELDATQPFVHSFEINTPLSNTPLHIEVEFEWKPLRCAKCQLFGHSCKQAEQEKTKEDAQLIHEEGNMALTMNGTNTGSKGFRVFRSDDIALFACYLDLSKPTSNRPR